MIKNPLIGDNRAVFQKITKSVTWEETCSIRTKGFDLDMFLLGHKKCCLDAATRRVTRSGGH